VPVPIDRATRAFEPTLILWHIDERWPGPLLQPPAAVRPPGS
jgi:hypothetical protein